MGFTATFEDEKPKEFTGRQRFSDIHRCEHKDGMIIVRASHSHQFGDKHNGVNMRDRIMTPPRAYKYVELARGMAARFMMNGEPTASAELSEIADDMHAKIREAIEWREKRNLSPDEVAELLKWKQQYY
jgi:hypothetical protein